MISRDGNKREEPDWDIRRCGPAERKGGYTTGYIEASFWELFVVYFVHGRYIFLFTYIVLNFFSFFLFLQLYFAPAICLLLVVIVPVPANTVRVLDSWNNTGQKSKRGPYGGSTPPRRETLASLVCFPSPKR
jgi:hypothetical protein